VLAQGDDPLEPPPGSSGEDKTGATASPDGQQEQNAALWAGRRRAAGIYGAIITASIMTAAGPALTTMSLAVSVLVTLVVYWLAEQYSEIVGRAAHGHVATWTHVRNALASGWPIVSASFIPLVVLVVARLAGASPATAADVGVAVAIVVLTFHGWAASRAVELRGWRLLLSTSVASGLGIVMVALKNVALHLH
jgi:hypothetical protein